MMIPKSERFGIDTDWQETRDHLGGFCLHLRHLREIERRLIEGKIKSHHFDHMGCDIPQA